MALHMDAATVLGFLGVVFSLASFAVKRMLALRVLAIIANLFFIGYGWAIEAWPGVLLNLILIPMNARRIWEIQKLTQEHGVNLAGVKLIVELEHEVDRMRQRMERMANELESARRRVEEDVSQTRAEIVPLSEVNRLRLVARPRGGGRRGPIPMGPVS